MSCRAALVIVALAGCAAHDPIVVELEARAGEEIELLSTDTLTTIAEATYRWELVEAPASSRRTSPPGDGPGSRFIPDVRGDYIIHRWLQYGVGEQLTHEFLIASAGRAPTASFTAPPGSVVTVGQTATFDGSGSTSAEGLALTYEWVMEVKPADSTAAIIGTGAQVSATFDRAGTYTIALVVIDERRSETARKVILAQ